MTIKNKKILKNVVMFNLFLLLTLADGNTSNLSKDESLNKSYHKPQSRNLGKQVLDLQKTLKSSPSSRTEPSISNLFVDSDGNPNGPSAREASTRRNWHN